MSNNKCMEDCFAYENETTCFCLTQMVCAKENCNFYKPKTEIDLMEIKRITNYTGNKKIM